MVVKMARYENIIGNKYGKLLVVGEVEKSPTEECAILPSVYAIAAIIRFAKKRR